MKFIFISIFMFLLASCDKGSSGGSSGSTNTGTGEPTPRTPNDGPTKPTVARIKCSELDIIVKSFNQGAKTLIEEDALTQESSDYFQFALGSEIGKLDKKINTKYILSSVLPAYKNFYAGQLTLRQNIEEGEAEAWLEYQKLSFEYMKKHVSCDTSI